MALIIPNSGKVALLDKMLKAALAVDEAYLLKLYQANLTLAETTVASDLNSVEATFTNYAPNTLTRSNWGGSAMVSGVAQATYNLIESWTCGVSGNTIYGYYVLGATSGTLLWAEAFAVARPLSSGDVLNLTPDFTFTHS